MIEEILLPFVAGQFRTDPHYRDWHIRIVNPLPDTVVLGLHIPEMKKIARQLSRQENCRALLDGFRDAAASRNDTVLDAGGSGLCQEEMIVWGMMLNYCRMDTDERLAGFSEFVPHMANWAVCDTVCGAAKWAAAKHGRRTGSRLQTGTGAGCLTDREKIWDWLDRWWSSDREFKVRFAVIMSMSYFLDGEWRDKTFSRLDSLDFNRITSQYRCLGKQSAAKVEDDVNRAVASGAGYVMTGSRTGTVPGPEPYYVRMAVAWLLATALARFPDGTRAYLRHAHLPDDVVKMYVRKARESFRTRDISPF